jgi:hypothetical protein
MFDAKLLVGDIIFDAKPDPVPYQYRISYKLPQLCLIMRICGRNDTSSLMKLHLISIALLSQGNMNALVDYAEGKDDAPTILFDPAVNRAISYILAFGLAEQQKTGNLKLTDSGRELADKIKTAGDLMLTEIHELSNLGKKLTERKVEELEKTRRFNYA